MSENFKQNFFRDEEQKLDYDDSAFYYFFIAILTVGLIPYTLYLLNQMIFGEKKVETSGRNCECRKCKETLKERQKYYKKSWLRFGFAFKVGLAVFLWYIWYLTATEISQIEPLKSFDPYQILGVEPSTETAEIKRAYRKLSLQFHPDKNPDDPLAMSNFIQISKAYATLTDEKARENWEKYGNPDGPGSFHVAIALPRFLLQKENQVTVLGAFFFVLLILVPGCFYFNLDQSQYEASGVLVENRKIFYMLINEHLILKQCPAILANSLEFMNLRVTSKEQQQILSQIKQNEDVKELIPKVTNKRGKQLDMKSLCLILAHLMRLGGDLNQHFKKDLTLILQKSPYLIQMMIEMAITLAVQFKMKQSQKKVTARNVLTIIDYSQYMVQAMWKDSDVFEQFPHMTPERVKQLRKLKKNIPLIDFCKLSTDERRELNLFSTLEEFDDCEKAIKVMPLVDVKIEVFVNGENEIAVGDFLTQRYTFTLVNSDDEEEGQGFAHSNKYPFLKKPQWYVMLTNRTEEDVFFIEPLTFRKKTEVIEKKDRMMQAGVLGLRLLIKNDSYIGFDKAFNIDVKILQEAPNRKFIQYDKEDIQAAKEQSLLQQAMDMGGDGDSDEEEEEETSTPQPKIATNTKPDNTSNPKNIILEVD